jgi:hypothetical protein
MAHPLTSAPLLDSRSVLDCVRVSAAFEGSPIRAGSVLLWHSGPKAVAKQRHRTPQRFAPADAMALDGFETHAYNGRNIWSAPMVYKTLLVPFQYA